MADQTSRFKIDEVLLKKGALVIRTLNHKLRQQMQGQIHWKGRI
jgi:hypothetical protein